MNGALSPSGGALFLYAEKTFKGEKVKGWKGEKMMFKGEKVKGWKGEKMDAPFKGEKVKGWKSEKMAAPTDEQARLVVARRTR